MAKPAADSWGRNTDVSWELFTAFCLLLLLFVGTLNYQGSGKGTRMVVFHVATEPQTQRSPIQLMKSGLQLYNNKPWVCALFALDIISHKPSCGHAMWLDKVECLDFSIGFLLISSLLVKITKNNLYQKENNGFQRTTYVINLSKTKNSELEVSRANH